MRKIVIVCGGTGGHIYPALAVAEQLPKEDIVFMGTEERLEAQLIPRAGYHFFPVASSRNAPLVILKGLWQAFTYFLKDRPSVILSTGGYVTIPVLLAGALLRIPSYLQEQNLLPGKVNRLMSLFAKKVCYAFPGSERYFPKKGMLTGNPVRMQVASLYKERRQRDPGKCHVLVMGGSQGAKVLDDTVTAVDFAALGCTLTHLNKQNYVHDMAALLATVDLAICRAGAMTLAELALCGIPAVLIPYPHAAENHQYLNAKALADAGAAVIIPQHRLSPESLTSIIKTLLEPPGQLANMADAMRRLAQPDAAIRIAALLKEEQHGSATRV